MTERPGSAPSATLPEPIPPTLPEETSFANPVAEEGMIERVKSPVAWGEPEPLEDAPGTVPDGIDFVNKSAIEQEAKEETRVEEITRAPTPVRVAWDEQIRQEEGSRRNSAASLTSRKSTRSTLEDLTALHPQAYVPYNVAKKNINRVINDMKLMREDHRKALVEVGRIYKEIEVETQVGLKS